MNNEAINITIQSLRTIFTVVLGLSLGEAFKQVVADRANDKNNTTKELVRWESLFSLVALLFFIIPFHHGMHRYFSDVYRVDNMPSAYASYLMWDTLAFTIEAGLFFLMSRSLLPSQWHYFYGAVMVILIVDTIWGLVVVFVHRPTLWPWIILNIGSLAVGGLLFGIFGLLVSGRVNSRWWWVTIWTFLMIVRTLIDYLTNWDFYFPPAK